MNEARRFLRYITPGLAFGVELWILLALTRWEQVAQDTMVVLRTEGLGVAASALLLSGGVGFLLSILHHGAHWTLGIWTGFANDARGFIRTAVARGELVILDPSTKEPIKSVDNIGPREAWQLLVALWHERAEASALMKGADERATSLGDLMHNAGTTLVGGVAAVVVWLVISFSAWETSPPAAPIAVATLLLITHVFGYWFTAKLAQGVVDIVLADALHQEAQAGKLAETFQLSK